MHVVWIIHIFLKETKRKMLDWLIIFILFLCSKRIKYAWNQKVAVVIFISQVSFQAVISQLQKPQVYWNNFGGNWLC